MLAPEDHKVDVGIIDERRHAAVGHPLGNRTWHEALRSSHPHLGAHAVRKALRHVVGKAPTACLTAADGDGGGPVLRNGLVDVRGQFAKRLVPANPFELATATLTHATHGIYDPARIMRDLRRGKPFGAQGAIRALVAGNAMREHDMVVAHVNEHRAGVVTATAHRRDGLDLHTNCRTLNSIAHTIALLLVHEGPHACASGPFFAMK